MRLIIEPTYDAVSRWAANYVASSINKFKPTEEKPFVLGLPTGSSPLGMYKHLIELNHKGIVSFRNVVTFNMDEYCNLPEDHEQSYHTFMWSNFFSHIDIRPENVNIHVLGTNVDVREEVAPHERVVALFMVFGQVAVLVHIEGHHVAERHDSLVVQLNQVFVHAQRRRPCGQTQHERFLFGGFEFIDARCHIISGPTRNSIIGWFDNQSHDFI